MCPSLTQTRQLFTESQAAPACACWGLPVKVLPGSGVRVRDGEGYLGCIQYLVEACGVFTVRAGWNREFTFVEERIVLESKGQEDQ